MEIKSKFSCRRGVVLAFAILLGGSSGIVLYAKVVQSRVLLRMLMENR